jgi:hypothetical protein
VLPALALAIYTALRGVVELARGRDRVGDRLRFEAEARADVGDGSLSIRCEAVEVDPCSNGLIGEAPEEIRIDGTITVAHELGEDLGPGEELATRSYHGTGTVRPTEGGGCEATWEMWPRR